MKLTQVTVRNLLSFAEEELKLDQGLVVPVGPNGAGKSNLFRLLALAGLALEWLEERSAGMPHPGQQSAAQTALVSYAAGRHQHAPDGLPSRLEIGIQLDRTELDDLVCFVRAALVSSVLTGQHSDAEVLAKWAENQVTAEKLASLERGALVLEHEGPPDAPWDISYEIVLDDVPFRWTLATRQAAGQLIHPVPIPTSPSVSGSYERVSTALFGPPGDSQQDHDLPLSPFSLSKLCRRVGLPVEAPNIQRPGASFRPDLVPHQRFAELAGIPAWTTTSNRTYTLAWVLRRVFQRGLIMLGEQFRGVATMATPLRQVGYYSMRELSGPLPGFEPYALPLRLLRLKNGSLPERNRFRQVQELFGKLAPGRDVDLRQDVSPPRQPAAQDGADTASADAELAVTVLVTHRDSPTAEWELPIQLCGAGTWEALVLAEAIAEAKHRVVVLDEPAANLHPGWQQLLRNQIRQRAGDGQFVLITHSPYLLPLGEEDDIHRLVRAAPYLGATRLSRITGSIRDSRAVLRDYSMSADARALLFASGAVLLEGETELGALPLWFAKSQAAQELGDPESLHLGFYNVGGDTHFKAPLTLLAALGVPWAIVCGGWLFDSQFRGNHIFRQVAAAGAGSAGIQSLIQTYVDDQTIANSVTFQQARDEGAKYGIFTLARGWTRDNARQGVTGDESFEFFVEGIFPGQLDQAEQEVGRSKSLRKGRWLAENNPCPAEIDQLYRDIVAVLAARGMPSRAR